MIKCIIIYICIIVVSDKKCGITADLLTALWVYINSNSFKSEYSAAVYFKYNEEIKAGGDLDMNIEEQFNLIAEEYDCNRKKFIPCFDDFYINSTEFIVSNIEKADRILDLGAGTGLLSYFWYKLCPNSEYVLVDIADDMLNVARKRFAGIDGVSYHITDYSKGLPYEDFDIVISALSIHHLEDTDKIKLFERVYNKLPVGGIFVNYDQFCAGDPEMNKWFDSYWEHQLTSSGLKDDDINLWKERRKLDRECSVEQELKMLRNAGFNLVKCIYSYRKFSVIVAIK